MNALESLEMLLWSLILLALAATYLAVLLIREMLHQRAYAKRVGKLPPATLQHGRNANGVASEHEPRPGAGSHWRAIFRGKANVLLERIAQADRPSPDEIVNSAAALPLQELRNEDSMDWPAFTGKRTERTVQRLEGAMS